MDFPPSFPAGSETSPASLMTPGGGEKVLEGAGDGIGNGAGSPASPCNTKELCGQELSSLGGGREGGREAWFSLTPRESIHSIAPHFFRSSCPPVCHTPHPLHLPKPHPVPSIPSGIKIF